MSAEPSSGQAPAEAPSAPPATQNEIERLKSQLAAQQEQINELRKRLEAQQKLLEKAFPAAVTAPTHERTADNVTFPKAQTAALVQSARAVSALPDSAPVRWPLSIGIGGVTFTPDGFIELAQVWRSKTVTSGLPTNFAAIPFNNTVLGHRRQTLSAGAYSRLGVRMNTRVHGFDVLGLVETDFLGFVPNNVATTTNSYNLRLRLAFVDLQKNRWEVLAGQAWSLLTPGRRGISSLTETLFLTQDLDPNIQSGLVWARTPQLRIVYHPNQSVAMGVSFESGDTYAGGSAGAGTITLPTALAPDYFGQVDLSTGNGNSVPNPNLDLIAKIAFDPKISDRSIHFEIAGLMNRFAFFNPLNNRRFSVIGGGVAINAGIEVFRKLTLFTNNYYSDGGGNFIFGEAPALIIRGDGAPGRR
jgi:hypothetical protein